MEEKKTKKNQESTPQWLKTIQLNSWEAELLISALVLYALFQIPDEIQLFSLKNIARDSRLQGFFSILKRAVELLKYGYLLHILVRGIWVASVGLSYVFPKGINKEKLSFKGRFKKELESNGSIIKNVLRLEEVSSIIYGISFILFGCLLGFGILIVSFVLIAEAIDPLVDQSVQLAGVIVILMLLYILLSFIIFLDFLTNGWLRRSSWSADWFYPVAVFFRVITLSFLVLISNIKGWKAYLVPFAILGIISFTIFGQKSMRESSRMRKLEEVQQTVYSSSNYENTRNMGDLLTATIPSDIIQQNAIRLFLKDMRYLDQIYLRDVGTKIQWESIPSDSSSKYLNKWIRVTIDTLEIQNLSWFNSQHPVEYEFGFTSFIDLRSIQTGPHILRMSFDTTRMKPRAIQLVKDKYPSKYLTQIHFIYDKP